MEKTITAIVALLFYSLIVMICWNAVMPHIFDLVRINFWQALALYALSSSLFKED